MRFHLTEEQEMLRASLRGTLARVATSENVRKAVDSGVACDPEAWAAVMEWGLGGLMITEADGGSGLGLLEAALAIELIGNAAAPGPWISHLMATLAIDQSVDATFKQKWMPRLISGKTRAAFAPSGGWMPEDWTARFEGELLTGKAEMVLGAHGADLLIVGLKGGQLACIEAEADGLAISSVNSSDLTRRMGNLTIEGSPGVLIADRSTADAVVNAGLILVAADALGGADKALAMSVDYAKIREQFGVPIGSFQAVKHQLADMALDVEPARALCWYAAYAYDQRLNDTSRVAALAKAHLADRFTSVVRAAIETHGGIGYTWEHDLHLYFRRALFDHAWLGSPSLHRERAASLAGWC